MNISSHSGLSDINKRVEAEIIKKYLIYYYRVQIIELRQTHYKNTWGKYNNYYQDEINIIYDFMWAVESKLTVEEIERIKILFKESAEYSADKYNMTKHQITNYKKNIREKLLPLLD